MPTLLVYKGHGAWNRNIKAQNDNNTSFDERLTSIEDFGAHNVIAASTANVTLSGTVLTLDGVTLADGDYVLLKDQNTGSQNGVYVRGTDDKLTRATYADSTADLANGLVVHVLKGSTNADQFYQMTNDAPTLGSTSLVFAQYDAYGAGTDGSGGNKILKTNATGDITVHQLSADHILKSGATIDIKGGAATSGSSIGVVLDTPASYTTGDKILSLKMGTAEKSYFDHAGAFHGNVTGEVTGGCSGASGTCSGDVTKASSVLTLKGGPATSGSSVAVAIDTPASYTTGDKILSLKMGTSEQSYFDHAGAFHGNVTGALTGNASTATEAGKLTAAGLFVSTEVTANGSEQNTAHGLAATPRAVIAVPSTTVDAGSVISYGTHDGTNCKVTATSGTKYFVLAFL